MIPKTTNAEIWKDLDALIRERGGEVVTHQNKFPLLMLCPPDSTLPKEIELYTRYRGKRVQGHLPPYISFKVEKIGQRAVINPVGLAEGKSRHACIEQRDEYEIDKRLFHPGGGV